MGSMCGVVLAFLLAYTSTSWGQGQKVYRIGALVAEDQFVPVFEGFKQRMAELGYIEGRNISYDFYNAAGDRDALKKLAEALVQKKPNVIVTSSTSATVPVANLTNANNLPVVFLSSGDPLRFVKSYASSGNNLTGISSASLDLVEKRIALLKELAPAMKRIILLGDPGATNYEHHRKIAYESAAKLGLVPSELTIQAENPRELKKKLFLIKRSLGDGLLVPPEAVIVGATEHVAARAIQEKLPHVGPNVQTVKRGLLAAYSSDYYSLGQQGAMLVDKILKGAKPADLPIEQPFKLQLSLNLKTAKAIGLHIPKSLILQANEVIE